MIMYKRIEIKNKYVNKYMGSTSIFNRLFMRFVKSDGYYIYINFYII